MADEPGKKKGFDLKHPGGKEFLIVGGVVLAGALAYFWWKNRQTAQAGQGTGTGQGSGSGITSPTGFLSAWIQDHQSSPRNTDKDKDTDTDSGGKGTKTHTVPNVVGMTDTAADAKITAAGLKVHDTNERKGGSGGSTKVTGQDPKGGTKVAAGSTVNITLGTPARKKVGNAHGGDG